MADKTNMALTIAPSTVDYHAVYSYPVGAKVAEFNSEDRKFHMIWYQGAPGTSFNNAPTGSLYTDTVTAYVYGLTDAGAWVQQ